LLVEELDGLGAETVVVLDEQTGLLGPAVHEQQSFRVEEAFALPTVYFGRLLTGDRCRDVALELGEILH